MKILHIVSAFDLGGAEEGTVSISIGLAKKDHDCCVIAVKAPREMNAVGDEFKERLQEHNIDFFEYGAANARTNLLHVPFKISRFCKRWEPDIVHSHTDIPDLMVSITGRWTPMTVARTIHNTVLWPTHHLTGRICEMGFRDDLIISISQGTSDAYEELRRRYKLPLSKFRRKTLNGIPPPSQVQIRGNTDFVNKIRKETDKIHFCFAGRFSFQKGFDVLLDALELIPDSYLNRMRLHAFGGGEDRARFEKHVLDGCLPVSFHIPVAGLRNLLSEFDAVILPSRFEGLARVALESMSEGVPLIGTTAPGLIEAFPPNWPLVVPVEDPQELSQVMVKFIDGRFNISELRKIAKDWGKQFNIDRMVDDHERAYVDYLSALRRGQSEFSSERANQ